MSSRTFYEEKVLLFTHRIRSLQNVLNGLALLRLAFFVGCAWSVYRLIGHYTLPTLLLAIGSAAAFIVCLNIFYRWKDRRDLAKQLRFVNENELGLLTGQPNRFPDGAHWLDSESYLDDLDIFGRLSLFHLLNRTTTVEGAAALAGRLRQPALEKEALTSQQEAIRTLAPQTEVRQLLTATGLVEKVEGALDQSSLKFWLNTPPRIYNRIWLRVLLILLSGFNVYALYLFFTTNDYALAVAGIIISRLIIGGFGRYTHQQHHLISHKQALLERYAGILAAFNKVETSGSPILSRLQDQTASAHTAIRRLAQLTNYFEQMHNLIVNLLLNTFFFYNLHCLIALERWKKNNRSDFPGWIEAVGEVEGLNSLATFAFNNPDYAYPVPATAPTAQSTPPAASPNAPALFIEATALAHPLIPPDRRIANDLVLGRDERLMLITGSNMSGKTTFLRTLGVNLLLAQCGLPVCATAFTFTPMQLLTSLRIDDSLQEQTSYFMAELKRLQRIIGRLDAGTPALVLIDEILRGTNSEDKTYGSAQFIHKLLQYPCLSLFATHDLNLGRLEEETPGAVSNYCFESTLENGQLHFDYRLQRGIARNRNASFLMHKLGII
jgi:hypothetical protein